MNESDSQVLGTVQGAGSAKPTTIASAATIAPVGFLTMISGTANIDNITPPVLGVHMLCLIGTGAAVLTTAGNILIGTTLVVQRPTFLVYNPLTAKYYIHSTANA